MIGMIVLLALSGTAYALWEHTDLKYDLGLEKRPPIINSGCMRNPRGGCVE